MSDRIFWEYLEKLPEQKTAWHDWQNNLKSWPGFNTFYINYLKVELGHAKFLECTMPCEHGYPRQIKGNAPYDIAAACPQKVSASGRLKFKDILLYSLRHGNFHKALCTALHIEPSCRRSECNDVWYLGEHYDMMTAVYLACQSTPAILTETVSSLCLLLRQTPFILLAPTRRGLSLEAQQMFDENNSVFLTLADKLILQPDGAFKAKCNISEW